MYAPLSPQEMKLKLKLSHPGVLPNTLYGILDKLRIKDVCSGGDSSLLLSHGDLFTINLQSLIDKGHLQYTVGDANGEYIFELKEFTP